jgi:hypothetical protein
MDLCTHALTCPTLTLTFTLTLTVTLQPVVDLGSTAAVDLTRLLTMEIEMQDGYMTTILGGKTKMRTPFDVLLGGIINYVDTKALNQKFVIKTMVGSSETTLKLHVVHIGPSTLEPSSPPASPTESPLCSLRLADRKPLPTESAVPLTNGTTKVPTTNPDCVNDLGDDAWIALYLACSDFCAVWDVKRACARLCGTCYGMNAPSFALTANPTFARAEPTNAEPRESHALDPNCLNAVGDAMCYLLVETLSGFCAADIDGACRRKCGTCYHTGSPTMAVNPTAMPSAHPTSVPTAVPTDFMNMLAVHIKTARGRSVVTDAEVFATFVEHTVYLKPAVNLRRMREMMITLEFGGLTKILGGHTYTMLSFNGGVAQNVDNTSKRSEVLAIKTTGVDDQNYLTMTLVAQSTPGTSRVSTRRPTAAPPTVAPTEAPNIVPMATPASLSCVDVLGEAEFLELVKEVHSFYLLEFASSFCLRTCCSVPTVKPPTLSLTLLPTLLPTLVTSMSLSGDGSNSLRLYSSYASSVSTGSSIRSSVSSSGNGSSDGCLKSDDCYGGNCLNNVCVNSPPTKPPTKSPTECPTERLTGLPTYIPMFASTHVATFTPTEFPVASPIEAPPTKAPTKATPLTKSPTKALTKSPTKAPTKSPTKALPTKPPPIQSPTPAVFTKTIALVDVYLQGCEVFLDCDGTAHRRSDGTVRAAAVTHTVGQVEFVFPQGKEEAQYTKELETCVESLTFDAAFVNQRRRLGGGDGSLSCGSMAFLNEVRDRRSAAEKAKKNGGMDTTTSVAASPVSARDHCPSDDVDDILMGGGCTGTGVSKAKDASESESCGVVLSSTSAGGSVGPIYKAKGRGFMEYNTVNEQPPINANIPAFVVLLEISFLIIGYAIHSIVANVPEGLLLIGWALTLKHKRMLATNLDANAGDKKGTLTPTNLMNGTASSAPMFGVLSCPPPPPPSPPPHTPSMQQ